jgi:endonuclease YncB( thermonuclease family)
VLSNEGVFNLVNYTKKCGNNHQKCNNNRMNAIRTLLISLVFFAQAAISAGPLTPGLVVAISDGDTITLLTEDKRQIKIRLAGIDTPEKKQAFGTKARDHLASRIFKHDVEVDLRKQDQYGRHLGVIYIGGVDINQSMIQDGYAWFYKHYAKEQPKEEALRYAKAEADARSKQRGLWADPNPVPPWEFRKEAKEEARAAKAASSYRF